MVGGFSVSNQVILLVEDNPDDVLLTQCALRKGNVMNMMVVASDGEEAIDYFTCAGNYTERNPCEVPAVVLLDLKLPKIDGLQVLAWMRAHEETRHIPVVVLTVSKDEEDVVRSYQLGVNSFIRKPVDFPEFTEVVRRLGLYWVLLNVFPSEERSA
jgi:two-component system response regulator